MVAFGLKTIRYAEGTVHLRQSLRRGLGRTPAARQPNRPPRLEGGQRPHGPRSWRKTPHHDLLDQFPIDTRPLHSLFDHGGCHGLCRDVAQCAETVDRGANQALLVCSLLLSQATRTRTVSATHAGLSSPWISMVYLTTSCAPWLVRSNDTISPPARTFAPTFTGWGKRTLLRP